MKKIMFNDRYGLTEAVLQGKKTVTRRVIACPRKAKGVEAFGCYVCSNQDGVITEIAAYDADERMIDGGTIMPPYKVGEIVAIAQSYKDCGEFDVYEAPKDTAGWKNKMFVKSELMPHQIRILDVRVERLQDITEEDCVKEGVRKLPYTTGDGNTYYSYWNGVSNTAKSDSKSNEVFSDDCCSGRAAGGRSEEDAAKKVFSHIIDKISRKGTWDLNPYVWRIEFELEMKN